MREREREREREIEEVVTRQLGNTRNVLVTDTFDEHGTCCVYHTEDGVVSTATL